MAGKVTIIHQVLPVECSVHLGEAEDSSCGNSAYTGSYFIASCRNIYIISRAGKNVDLICL